MVLPWYQTLLIALFVFLCAILLLLKEICFFRKNQRQIDDSGTIRSSHERVGYGSLYRLYDNNAIYGAWSNLWADDISSQQSSTPQHTLPRHNATIQVTRTSEDTSSRDRNVPSMETFRGSSTVFTLTNSRPDISRHHPNETQDRLPSYAQTIKEDPPPTYEEIFLTPTLLGSNV